GAEIVARHENAGVTKLRLVEHEIGIFAAVLASARPHEQERLVIRLEVAHRLHGRDLVGVDVVTDERDGDAGVIAKRLHQAVPARMIVPRPAPVACRCTVEKPGTTMATTPRATRRPPTTAAAASRSGSRLLVQEPMNTRFTGKPASAMPGLRSI